MIFGSPEPGTPLPYRRACSRHDGTISTIVLSSESILTMSMDLGSSVRPSGYLLFPEGLLALGPMAGHDGLLGLLGIVSTGPCLLFSLRIRRDDGRRTRRSVLAVGGWFG